MKDFRNPSNIHAPLGSYSHQIEITGSERMLILSGQVGMHEDGTLPDDALEQVDVALENILRNLQAANMGVQDIVKLTYYLVGEIDTAGGANTPSGLLVCGNIIFFLLPGIVAGIMWGNGRVVGASLRFPCISN